MDNIGVTNDLNNEEKAENIQLLIPNQPQFIIPSHKSENQLQIAQPELIRSIERSFNSKSDLAVSRRPSAIISAIQRERSDSGNFLLEYVLHYHMNQTFIYRKYLFNIHYYRIQSYPW